MIKKKKSINLFRIKMLAKKQNKHKNKNKIIKDYSRFLKKKHYLFLSCLFLHESHDERPWQK